MKKFVFAQKPILWAIGAIFILMFTVHCTREQADGPYRADANPREEIRAAIQQAKEAWQHILLVFGANWCPWCRALHHLMEENQEVHSYLNQNYRVVLVDVGRRDRNMDLDSRYGNPVKLGLPALVVLDEHGELLTLQETGTFEIKSDKGKGHDPEKFLGFLEKWRHPLPDEK